MSITERYRPPQPPTYFVPTQAISPESSQDQSGGAATPADALEEVENSPEVGEAAPPRNVNPVAIPTTDPNAPVVSHGTIPDSVIAENQQRADNILSLQINKAAISKEYDNIISQLRDQYQFAETPEEKARLKYMLADIELEFDAANQSIEEVYELRQQDVSAMGPDILSRSRSEGQQAGSYFTSLAGTMEQDAANVRNRTADEFTGLGIENVDQVENEWTMLIRSFAPIQQTYIEDQGRQTINDLARIEASMEMQSASQLAQLERMRTGTVNTAQYRHMQQVEQRIETEKQDARARITSIMLDKLARLQSAAEFNAGLALRADEMLEEANNPDEYYGGLVNYALAMAEKGPTDYRAFEEGFIIRSGGVRPDNFISNIWLTTAVERQRGNVDIALNYFLRLGSELEQLNRDGRGSGDYALDLRRLVNEAESMHSAEVLALENLEGMLVTSNSRFRRQ